jgi:hypothetical protein
MTDKNSGFLTKKVVIATGLISVSLCLFVLLIQYLIVPNISIERPEKFQLEITPISSEEVQSQQATAVVNDQTVINTPPVPGVIAIGMKLFINGTANEGLRMHSDPGINQPTLFLAKEGEEITIIDGPIITDGLIWWKINVVNDPTRIGWSVQDYLKEIKQ